MAGERITEEPGQEFPSGTYGRMHVTLKKERVHESTLQTVRPRPAVLVASVAEGLHTSDILSSASSGIR